MVDNLFVWAAGCTDFEWELGILCVSIMLQSKIKYNKQAESLRFTAS